MPTLLINDALGGKKVRLKLKDETTVERTLVILQKRYDHLGGRDLMLSLEGTVLDLGMTLGQVVDQLGLDDRTFLDLDERASHVDDEDLEMADLDTIEAVTALEQQLDALEETAGDLLVDGAGEDGFFDEDEFASADMDAIDAIDAIPDDDGFDSGAMDAIEAIPDDDEDDEDDLDDDDEFVEAEMALEAEPIGDDSALELPSAAFSLDDDVSSVTDEAPEPVARIDLPLGGPDPNDLLEEDVPPDDDAFDEIPFEDDDDDDDHDTDDSDGDVIVAAPDESSVEDRPAPAPRPAAAPRPAPAGGLVDRKVTVRHPKRLIAGRNHALTVVLTGKDPADPGAGCVEVIPILPGCLVVPSQRNLDVAGARVEGTFWVTPFSTGGLAEAQIEIRRGWEFELVPTPMKGARLTPLRWMVALGLLILTGTGIVAFWQGKASMIAERVGGDLPLGAAVGGGLIVLAALARLFLRSKEAEPRSGRIKFGG